MNMEKEIDLLELLKSLWRRRMPILAAAVVAVVLSSVFCFVFLEDEYSAKTSLYILNQQNSENITNSDLTASASLVNDYREIILSNKVTNRVEEELGLENLKAFDITVESKNNTRIIEIGVVSKDAYLSTAVANGLAKAFSIAVVDIMRVDNVSIIDEAVIPEAPSGPAREKYILLAAIAAAMLVAGIFAVIEILNNSLKTAENVERELDLPVLAQFTQINEIKNKYGRR